MIIFNKLWEAMKEKSISEYTLILEDICEFVKDD